ncbi:hypothetical protein LZD49_18455 [Dyadobacter sp. CY261]|uniref:hypothetical protein n=1 Tax=Dyadobacter sp. CY261 TaxID=2907203 RepID=UPI001F2B2100|nr:hypothetical protein [Dyadobacter sp. CY261]MCF0072470.1 hypothetical protein [Dyadobacter sp. CY261]
MQASYNPFEILNLPTLKTISRLGNRYLVLQRFHWPGIKEGRGFIGTPYMNEAEAKAHQASLSEKEGKTLNLILDEKKLTDLVTDPQYFLFLSSFRDQQWNARIVMRYQHSITSFLNTQMNIRALDEVTIYFRLEFGRLKATVTAFGDEHEFDAHDMIKYACA